MRIQSNNNSFSKNCKKRFFKKVEEETPGHTANHGFLVLSLKRMSQEQGGCNLMLYAQSTNTVISGRCTFC